MEPYRHTEPKTSVEHFYTGLCDMDGYKEAGIMYVLPQNDYNVQTTTSPYLILSNGIQGYRLVIYSSIQ